jgi:hypothetical protein
MKLTRTTLGKSIIASGFAPSPNTINSNQFRVSFSQERRPGKDKASSLGRKRKRECDREDYYYPVSSSMLLEELEEIVHIREQEQEMKAQREQQALVKQKVRELKKANFPMKVDWSKEASPKSAFRIHKNRSRANSKEPKPNSTEPKINYSRLYTMSDKFAETSFWMDGSPSVQKSTSKGFFQRIGTNDRNTITSRRQSTTTIGAGRSHSKNWVQKSLALENLKGLSPGMLDGQPHLFEVFGRLQNADVGTRVMSALSQSLSRQDTMITTLCKEVPKKPQKILPKLLSQLEERLAVEDIESWNPLRK